MVYEQLTVGHIININIETIEIIIIHCSKPLKFFSDYNCD